jgi:hypothetical protein
MISEDLMQFLVELKKKGTMSRNTQKIFGSPSYYFAVAILKKQKLIQYDGVTGEKGNEKLWKLTEKGRTIADLSGKMLEIKSKIEENLGNDNS